MSEKTKIVGIDFLATPDEMRVVKSLIEPALSLLLARINIHTDVVYTDKAVGITLYHPDGFPDAKSAKEMLSERMARLTERAV